MSISSPFHHEPVMLQEMLSSLMPHEGGIYLDGTFGGGGYSRAILKSAKCRVIALDRDPEAQDRAQLIAKEYPNQFQFFSGTFSQLPAIARQENLPLFDGIVFDFGISSFQIDEAQRGFSLRFEGPLDMRMSKEGLSAADVVNTYSEKDLADIIYQLGEEKKSRMIARAIVAKRKEKPFETTLELANLIKEIYPKSAQLQHPATLTFQALRIFVNNELIEVEKGLIFAEEYLKIGGKLVTVTFHSLEDLVVKNFVRERSRRFKVSSRLLPGEPQPTPPTFRDLYPKGLSPSKEEIKQNPRSRSARLRCAQRLDSGENVGTDAHVRRDYA